MSEYIDTWNALTDEEKNNMSYKEEIKYLTPKEKRWQNKQQKKFMEHLLKCENEACKEVSAKWEKDVLLMEERESE